MKSKILVVSPRIPESASNRRDRRFFSLLKALAAKYEVHLIFIQSLFTSEESKKTVEDLGIRVLSFQAMRSYRNGKLDDQTELFIKEGGYAFVIFNTHYIAKYYLPLLDVAALDSVIVIDAGRSHYVSEIIAARESRDPLRKATAAKSAEDNRMKEIPFYNGADAVLVESAAERDELARDVPHVSVEVVAQPGEGTGSDEVNRREAEEVFSRLRKRTVRDAVPDVIAVAPPESAPLGKEDLFGGLSVEPGIRIEAGAGRTVLAAYNEALKRVRREYGLIVPAGTIVPERSLRRLLHCALSHPAHGIVVPAHVVIPASTANARSLREHAAKQYVSNFGYWQEMKRMPAACMLVKRELIEAVGVLDDRYDTLAYAVIDMCYKAFQAGYRVVVNNDAVTFRRDLPAGGERTDADRRLLHSKWCDTGIELLEDIGYR